MVWLFISAGLAEDLDVLLCNMAKLLVYGSRQLKEHEKNYPMHNFELAE